MAWCYLSGGPWQRRMHGALSRPPLASDPWVLRLAGGPKRPAQMDLFEGMQS
jgi:hypothetical protein